MYDYDVIVVGAGHAGIEAALGSSRRGRATLLISFRRSTIGHMSCNPAIGGVGKGQLVKEVDALGGEMGKAADGCAIQFRILNASKGAAVQSSRAQIDRRLYKEYMQGVIAAQQRLDVIEDEVVSVIVEEERAAGVVTASGKRIPAKAVVLTPGTFLNGLIHVGLRQTPGGRREEPASCALPDNLKALGFRLLRFKTGTCPRLDKKTIDFARLIIQEGDAHPRPFSFSHARLDRPNVPCHITYTNERTHQIIRDNLSRSPLYTGVITATGVRYCPSIEDKVVKFSDRIRHQLFLEPEGLEVDDIYPNGLSTSLPEEVQEEMVHSIDGLREARILHYGYGIEHTVVEPTQLYPTLETKRLPNLFCAGQINGTTGYEEAAAQGLVAGINASLRAEGKEGIVFDRATSYIGVLCDDLTTKGTNEPYRMFTSRVEYRLLLREDNADVRLRKIGYEYGLVSESAYGLTREKEAQIQKILLCLKKKRAPAGSTLKASAGGCVITLGRSTTLEELLRRPQICWEDVAALLEGACGTSESVGKGAEIEVKYAGFITRQLREVERFRNLEKIRLPRTFDYSRAPCLSREIREKLRAFKPINLGQASRISGVTPVAISILMVYLKKASASPSSA